MNIEQSITEDGTHSMLELAAFLQLHRMVTTDLCNVGRYEPADDNDNEEYDEMYCHEEEEEPAIYILRRDLNARTLTISAHDYELRDIEINSPADWEQHKQRLASEGRLLLEPVPDEEHAETALQMDTTDTRS